MRRIGGMQLSSYNLLVTATHVKSDVMVVTNKHTNHKVGDDVEQNIGSILFNKSGHWLGMVLDDSTRFRRGKTFIRFIEKENIIRNALSTLDMQQQTVNIVNHGYYECARNERYKYPVLFITNKYAITAYNDEL